MSRRESLMARECPTRYEKLDPSPVAEAVIPPRPQRVRELAALYVRSMSELDPDDLHTDHDPDDWEDYDPDMAVMTDAQFIVMAEASSALDDRQRKQEVAEANRLREAMLAAASSVEDTSTGGEAAPSEGEAPTD